MVAVVPADLLTRRWKLATWLCAIAVLLALLFMAQYLTSPTEMVRIRNALLVVVTEPGDFDWTPSTVPASFVQERGPPDPYFVALAARLNLVAMESDWDRAIAISKHLLSHAALNGNMVQANLRETERRITQRGDGYCGDFTRAFMALSLAAGMPVRAWAFSFDGYGGYGHILPEIWNRQLSRWQLVDVFDNYYFHGKDGVAISATELRTALAQPQRPIFRALLSPQARPGHNFEDKAWDYFQRGLPQWYMVWGNNVFSYDRVGAKLGVDRLPRSLEQLVLIATGTYPPVKLLEVPGNRSDVMGLWQLRWMLFLAVIAGATGSVGVVLCRHNWKQSERRAGEAN